MLKAQIQDLLKDNKIIQEDHSDFELSCIDKNLNDEVDRVATKTINQFFEWSQTCQKK